MLAENTIPVVSKIPTNRKDAVAFAVNGALTKADVENLYGLFKAATLDEKKIDMLLSFKEYDGIDWNTLFNEDTSKLRSEIFEHLNRYAIVGGPAWLHLAIEFFRPFGKIDAKWFAADDIDLAWQFIDAKPK